jgi:hypothetical protein
MMMFKLLVVLLQVAIVVSFQMHQTRNVFRAAHIQQPPRVQRGGLEMTFGGIAEKLGSIVELVSGQGTITEANIEDTLKVREGERGGERERERRVLHVAPAHCTETERRRQLRASSS